LLSLLRSGRLQRKARLSQPGDPLEHEADRAANAVVSGAGPRRTSFSLSSPTEIQRMPTEEQKLAMELGLGPIGGSVERVEPTPPPEGTDMQASELVRLLYGGRSLDERTRGLMESVFAEDFSDVRIHTGYRAGEAADSVQARAFTVREDIVFAEGQYAPETTEGQRLLAHELAHVLQQRRPTGGLASETDAERDAVEAAHEVASHGTPAVRERAAPGIVQKQELPRERYQQSVTGQETQEQVKELFAAQGIYFKGNATWRTEAGGYWYLEPWQVVARDTGDTLSMQTDVITGPGSGNAAPANAATAKQTIKQKRQQDWEAAQAGMWNTFIDLLQDSSLITMVPQFSLDWAKAAPPAPTGDELRDYELRKNYEGGGYVITTFSVAAPFVDVGGIFEAGLSALGKAPALELYGIGGLGGGRFVPFAERWAASGRLQTTEGIVLEQEDLAELSIRKPTGGRSVGQIQGRENRLDVLALHEFDPNQPAHIRGWLRNERRALASGNISEPRTPPGYVLGHGPLTPAREGFDYWSSTLTTQDINDIQELVRRKLESMR
jgi:hypothetical protein